MIASIILLTLLGLNFLIDLIRCVVNPSKYLAKYISTIISTIITIILYAYAGIFDNFK